MRRILEAPYTPLDIRKQAAEWLKRKGKVVKYKGVKIRRIKYAGFTVDVIEPGEIKGAK